MHLPDIPQCIIQMTNVHISGLNGALRDMGKIGLFHNHDVLKISMET